MKTLVYRNYSKFLGATDTIRKMKTTADAMENQAKELQSQMNQITASLSILQTSLEPKHTKIHEIGGIHSIVSKVCLA
jgi:Tfp pilus assembly protein FimV